MSNAPYLLKGARWGYRMGNGEVVDSMLHEGLTCAINGCHMGMTAEEIVKRYDVSRADQDAFAAESQRARPSRRSARASSIARSSRSTCRRERAPPIRSRGTSTRAPERPPEKLAALRPAFAKDGSVTAGNSSGINDGAAALVVATEKKAQRARTEAARAHPRRTARPASIR